MSFAGLPSPLYVTRADLSSFYGENEIARFETSGLDLTSIILAVNEEVDSYVRHASREPLPAIPAAIKFAAADMVRFRLFTNTENKLYSERYGQAIAYLKAVAAGTVVLPFASTDEGVQDAPGSLASVSENPNALGPDAFFFW